MGRKEGKRKEKKEEGRKGKENLTHSVGKEKIELQFGVVPSLAPFPACRSGDCPFIVWTVEVQVQPELP